jgi:hypothetical protein
LPSGPIIGEAYPAADKVPRAVSREFFDRVCPNPTILLSQEVNTDEGGDETTRRWMQKLNSIEDPCIEIGLDSASQIFNLWYELHRSFLVRFVQLTLTFVFETGCSAPSAFMPYGPV